MKKLCNIAAVSCLLFLMLSVMLVLPIQAKPISESSLQISSLKVSQSAENIYIIEVGQERILIEIISNDHYKVSYINENGTTTKYEINSILSTAYNVSANSGLVNTKGALEKIVYMNGKEAFRLPTNQISAPQSSEFSLQSNPSTLLDNTYYWWDYVRFVEGQYIAYPHPDRDYEEYNISPFSDWSIWGNQLLHVQFAQSTSQALASGGPVVIGAAIGAVIGLLGGGIGVFLGGILGAVIAEVLVWFSGWIILDEWDCMWWWISKAIVQWFLDNLINLFFLFLEWGELAVFSEMASALLSYGYIRVGSYTFLDAIGVGDPNPEDPPQASYWIVQNVSDTPYAYGTVQNPAYLVGDSNDGNYAHIYGGNLDDGGNIIGATNSEAHGHIYLYGYSDTGYYTHLYVFVSYYNNYDWYQVSVQTVYPGAPHWIDGGSYEGNFNYIAIVAIDDNYNSANLFVDSIIVSA
jgi:hypothetical protein